MATKKQKAAARRNIKKAQAALRKKRRGGHKHTKRVRRAHHTAHAHPKKRRVSRKQRAAARRNIKKAQAGKRKRKACRRAAGRRGAAKRAGKRMPKMPKRCAPKAHTHRKRRKSSSGSPKRRKSGRRRSKKHDTQTSMHTLPGMGSFFENPVRRRRRKHHPHHRHHRHHGHRHHNPLGFAPLGFLANPVRGFMHVGSMILGLGVGYVATDAIDRAVATHPLQALPGGAGFTDTPGDKQIYDSEASLLPLWSDPKRLGVNAVLIFLPWAVAKFVVRGAKGKAFLHTAALGSFARLGGKLIGDGVAYAAKPGNPLATSMWANRLYSPEIAAQARLDQVAASGLTPLMASAAGTSATQPAGQFAGLPKNTPALKKGVGDPDPGPDPDICTTSEMTKEVNNAVNANPADNSHAIVQEHSLPFNPLDPTGEGCDCLPFVPMPALTSSPPSPVSPPGAPPNYMPPGVSSGGAPPAPPPPAAPAPHAYFPR